MKTRIRLLILTLISLIVRLQADQNLAGNVTVTGGAASGNPGVTGVIGADGNSLSLGSQEGSSGTVAGTVCYHSAAVVDGLLCQGGSRAMWTSKDDATPAYVRNTGAWAAGLTGISAKVVWVPMTWNGEPAIYNPFGAIAVAPDIVLVEYHVKGSFTVGMTLRFVTEDGANTVATRAITAVADYALPGGVSGDGWGVCRLDSPLPAGVKWLKVAPANLADYLPDIAAKLPVLRMDSHELECSVAELSALPESASVHFTLAAAASAPRNGYYDRLIVGDSSNPVCMVVNGELVLLGLHYGSLSAPRSGSTAMRLTPPSRPLAAARR